MADYLDKAVLAARKAADYIKNKTGSSSISNNETHDLKLNEDYDVELIIKSMLEDTKIPVVGEESYLKHEYETYWLVDPIDGSVNYFKGIPFYCVAICLMQSGRCSVSVILDITRDKLYTAQIGKGSFCNGKRISVSNINDKKEALLLSAITPPIQSNLQDMQSYIQKIANTKKIRMIGSAALSLCYVAEGVAEICDLYKVHIWDVYAAALLVEEAGGEVKITPHEDTLVSIEASNGLLTYG